MIQHRVWIAGQNTKVISLYARLCDMLDVSEDDDLIIDWVEAMRQGLIKVRRK